MQVTATSTINVPLAKAWAGLADHAAMSGWGPGVKVIVTPATGAEPNGVGAVRRIKPAIGPGPSIVEEVTEFETDRVLGYKAVKGVPFKDYSGRVVLTAVGQKTNVQWSLSATQRIPVAEKLVLTVVSKVLLFLYSHAAK